MPAAETDQIQFRWRVVYSQRGQSGVMFIEAPSAIEAHFKAKREQPEIMILATSPDRRDP